MKSTKRNAAAAERNNANDMRRFLIAAQVITQKPIATTLVTSCWMILHDLKAGA